MQTPTQNDRLGLLEADILRAQKEAETVAAAVGKNNPTGATQLKAAAKELGEKRRLVVKARETLLGFGGLVRGRQELARQKTDDPAAQARVSRFLGAVQERLASQLVGIVERMSEHVTADISTVASVIQSIGTVQDLSDRTETCEELVNHLTKILAAGERAVDKIAEGRVPEPEEGLVDDDDDDDEIEIEVDGDEVEVEDEHGYDLTAAELPDFIKEKVEEREKNKGDEDKGDEDKGDEKKAEKPKKGEVPPQFLKHMKGKKADEHGYVLTDDAPHGYRLNT